MAEPISGSETVAGALAFTQMSLACGLCNAAIPDSHYDLLRDNACLSVCWPCWRKQHWWRRFTSRHEYDREWRTAHTGTLPPDEKRHVSPLDDFAAVFFRRNQRAARSFCVRCGDVIPDRPKYTATEGKRFWQANIPHFFCLTCWDELTPEGRYQWLLMGLAAWVADHRPDLGRIPIPDDGPRSSQARYREMAYHAEQWRRLLFEPEGWDGCAQLGPDRRVLDGDVPRYGPDYVPYTPCYVNRGPESAPHQWHDIPEMGLALCTVCHAWSRLPDHVMCLPWCQEHAR